LVVIFEDHIGKNGIGQQVCHRLRDITGNCHTLSHFAPRANIIIQENENVKPFFTKNTQIVNFFTDFFAKVKKVLPFGEKMC
jgi:hypothetical protein